MWITIVDLAAIKSSFDTDVIHFVANRCHGSAQRWSRSKSLVASTPTYCSNLPQRFRLFIRSTGLGIIAVIRGEETAQVLIHESRRAALPRSAVHILSVLESVALIAADPRGKSIGHEL
jgi:hypothetical protein